MADCSKDNANVYNSTAWTSYNTYRPTYPPSLWSLILSHCRSNGGGLDAVHDVGAGSGQAAAILAQDFSTIYVSDPSEHNIETARQHIGAIEYKGGAPTFHYAVCTGAVSYTHLTLPTKRIV